MRAAGAGGGAERLIEVQGVSKTFASGGSSVPALRDATLALGGGEFVAVVGPSGCGKSTLLRILAGVTTATSGSVRVGGRDPADTGVRIGMVFQTPVLLPWRSVLSNVLLPIEVLREDRRRFSEAARDLLKLVGLEGFEHARAYHLSGGMQQRAALCRALITKPVLLLMDEPFGALDALTREHLNLELQRIWMATRTTVLFVTHSIPEAVFLADRVAVFTPRPGRVREVVDVTLPRPRTLPLQDTPAFGAFTREVREALEQR